MLQWEITVPDVDTLILWDVYVAMSGVLDFLLDTRE